MNHKSRTNRIDRRTVLALSGAALGAWGLSMRPAEAVSGAWLRLEQARAVIGDAAPVSGAIALELPLVSENGASVPLTLRIDRAMDSKERVETIHLFAPRNPDPQIAVFHLTELAGQAEIATRIRLNESQTVIAVARTASGEVLVGERDVRVTVTGCLIADDTYESEDGLQTRLRAPQHLAAGQPGEVLSIITHPMETGLRADSSGATVPKRIIERLEARLDGEPALVAELNRSISANPYLRFFVAPRESATLDLVWTEDTGRSAQASARIEVG